MIDTYGQDISEHYRIMTDPFFERRLQAFDSRLKLMFDQNSKRWVILEKAYDNSGFNCILKCEYPNSEKTPRPLGDWVFEYLVKFRQMYELKKSRGVDNWIQDLRRESEYQKQKIKEKNSQEHELMIRDDLLQWRKASKELQGLPVADATAGYRKV